MAKQKKKAKAKKSKKVTKRSASPTALKSASNNSKAAIVIELLERSGGLSIAELVKKTGWQPHTGRAMISGLRKVGHKIETSSGKDGKTAYRIVGTKKATARARR